MYSKKKYKKNKKNGNLKLTQYSKIERIINK